MTGRKTSACSDRCRAVLSRRRRIPVPREQFLAIGWMLQALLEESYRAKMAVEKMLGG
jgi:hypothetical protein